MRIIGGYFKSRILNPGKNFRARPTTDFARENLFNILSNRYNLENKIILDLFAGTGSISFEFASRGCHDVTCVESEHVHFEFICSVIDKLGLKKHVKPLKKDVFTVIQKIGRKFDIIFADPPYDLKRLTELPDLIMQGNLLNNEGLFILEHGERNDFSCHPDFKEKRVYGSVNFTIFQHPI
jgi:16S rRNA (guanine966-N2)-methyltransferase